MPGSYRISVGGEGGIRTRGGVAPTHAFQACSFGHSDTSPKTSNIFKETGGEEGIRTLGPRERSTVFETVPIDHSGTSPRSGPAFYDDRLCLAKKRRSSSRHLSASRPPRFANGGPSRGSAARSMTVPQAPARSSSVPQMTSGSRASRHAAAHIGHGSRVT
jgi:hypothetical protein